MRQLCLLLGAMLSLVMSAGNVEEVLRLFDNEPSATVANRFFGMLQQQGITDQQVKATNATPADTLRQQVWYWAAE